MLYAHMTQPELVLRCRLIDGSPGEVPAAWTDLPRRGVQPRSLGVLGSPAGFRTVTTQIYADLSIGGDPASFLEAVTLALLLVLLAVACVAPTDAVLGPRLRSTRPASTQGAQSAPRRLAWWSWPSRTFTTRAA